MLLSCDSADESEYHRFGIVIASRQPVAAGKPPDIHERRRVPKPGSDYAADTRRGPVGVRNDERAPSVHHPIPPARKTDFESRRYESGQIFVDVCGPIRMVETDAWLPAGGCVSCRGQPEKALRRNVDDVDGSIPAFKTAEVLVADISGDQLRILRQTKSQSRRHSDHAVTASNRVVACAVCRMHDQQPPLAAEPIVDRANHRSVQCCDAVDLIPGIRRDQHQTHAVRHAAVASAWREESIVRWVPGVSTTTTCRACGRQTDARSGRAAMRPAGENSVTSPS